MRVKAVHHESLDGLDIGLIGFAEHSSGAGRSLILQFPTGPAEDDEDDWGYCLCTETGAVNYGGVERIDLDEPGHRIALALTTDAAADLRLDRYLVLQLAGPASDLFTRLGCLARGAGVEVANASIAAPEEDETEPPPPLDAAGDAGNATVVIALRTPGAQGSHRSFTVQISDTQECDFIADLLASWIATTTTDFWIEVDGPGARSELRMIRTGYDKEFLFDSLASAAHLR